MVSRIVRVLQDDLDGGPAHEVVNFAFDGIAYEIDLSFDNAHLLREQLEPFVAAGRSVRGRRNHGASRRAAADHLTVSRGWLVRTWAREQGIWVHPSGGIPHRVLAAYEAAHR